MGDRCTGCEQPILWALTYKNRRRIPLDPSPSPNGNQVIMSVTEHGTLVVRALRRAERHLLTLTPEPRYMPHHATCPNVDQFRKRATT